MVAQSVRGSLVVRCVSFSFLPLLMGGCASALPELDFAPKTQLQLVDYRDTDSPQCLQVIFEEASFHLDPRGNLTLALRHAADPQSGASHDQVVTVRTVWRSIPGQTFAHESQINGTVVYAILGRGVDSTYEGAGSVFFFTDPMTGKLSGRLNRVVLEAKCIPGGGEPVFHKLELSGQFHAEENARVAVQTANDIERMFGPRTPQPN